MKFFVAVVMLALAVSAQAGLLPLAYSAAPWGAYPYAPVAYTAHSAPISYAAHGYPGHAYAGHGYAGLGYAAPIAHYAAPAVHAVPVVAEGTYVAANRGAVHTAPLPGHIQSASSINLAPAPGTW